MCMRNTRNDSGDSQISRIHVKNAYQLEVGNEN